jgi:flagellar hook-length control protein FliK
MSMTQNVKAAVANLISDSRSYQASTVKSKNQAGDFGSIMNSNLKSKSTATVQNMTGNGNTTDKATKGIKDNNRMKNTAKENMVNTGTDNNISAKHQDTVDKTKDAAKAVKEELNESINQNENLTCDYVQNLLALLKDTVKNSLGISEEELNKAMESLGLNAFDLLNVDNLKLLALQVNGKDDITEVLTNENLANTLNDLIQAVDDLKEEQNLTMSAKELNEIIQNSQTATESHDNQSLNEVTFDSTADKSAQPVQNPKESDNSTVKKDDREPDIRLEVYKTKEDSSKGYDLKASVSQEKDSKQADIQTESPIELFIQNLATKGNENSLNFNEQIAYTRQMQDITNQIVEQIKVTIKPDQTSMELQLNPESLGKINLSVVAKDGAMTAHFTTENELVKEAIENQIQVLKDNLNNQGIKVDTIEVTVSDFSFDQSNQASGGRGEEHRGSSRNRNFVEEDTEAYVNSNIDEGLAYASLYQSDSQIDYTA